MPHPERRPKAVVEGRTILAAVLSLVLLASPAFAADTLHVGKASPTATATLPVDIGVQQGLFAKEGLDVDIVNFEGSAKMHQANAAGSIDMGLGGGPELAFIAKGAPELAVCNAVPAPRFFGIAVGKDSPINSLADLRGTRISVGSVGGLAYWLTLELARQQGWGPDGIKIVSIGNAPTSVLAALKTHNVDAAYTATAVAFMLEETGQGRLLAPATSYAGNIGGGVIFASNAVMQAHPNDVRRFLAGWIDTVRWMRAHRDQTIALESALTGFPTTVQAKEFDLTISMFSHDCRFDDETLSNLKRSFVDLKLVDQPPDMTKLYTETFVPRT